mgnify:CR=1 FL=1
MLDFTSAEAVRIFRSIVFFYSNDHQPVHAHGKVQDRESKAEFLVVDGEVREIKISSVKGKDALSGNEMYMFKTLVERFKEDILRKWIDFFVMNKEVTPVKISQRLD